MPDPVTWGHLLMLLALVAGLFALWQFLAWARNRGAGRGTPRYAHARDGRRYGLFFVFLALILIVLARLTPLGEVTLLGGMG